MLSRSSRRFGTFAWVANTTRFGGAVVEGKTSWSAAAGRATAWSR